MMIPRKLPLTAIILGPPNSGKSNLVRQLVTDGSDSKQLDKFYNNNIGNNTDPSSLLLQPFKCANMLDQFRTANVLSTTTITDGNELDPQQQSSPLSFNTNRFKVAVYAMGQQNLVRDLISGSIEASIAIWVVSSTQVAAAFNISKTTMVQAATTIETTDAAVELSTDSTLTDDASSSSSSITQQPPLPPTAIWFQQLELVRQLGAKQLVIVVNKYNGLHPSHSTPTTTIPVIDTLLYTETQQQDQLVQWATLAGYDPTMIQIVPQSLQSPTKHSSHNQDHHHHFHHLFSAIDSTLPPPRLQDLPLRIPIQKAIRRGGIGTILLGKIETGLFSCSGIQQFNTPPSRYTGQMFSLEMNHQSVGEAGPNDYVGWHAKNCSIRDIWKGSICSNVHDRPAQRIQSVRILIVTMKEGTKRGKDGRGGYFRIGYEPIVKCHLQATACRLDKVLELVDPKTGDRQQPQPQQDTDNLTTVISLTEKGQCALIQMSPVKTYPGVTFDLFDQFPTLGRVCLWDQNKMVAVGIVMSVVVDNEHRYKSRTRRRH